jgi:hypothetical protein
MKKRKSLEKLEIHLEHYRNSFKRVKPEGKELVLEQIRKLKRLIQLSKSESHFC